MRCMSTFCAVGTSPGSFWIPSLGPTSTILTAAGSSPATLEVEVVKAQLLMSNPRARRAAALRAMRYG